LYRTFKFIFNICTLHLRFGQTGSKALGVGNPPFIHKRSLNTRVCDIFAEQSAIF